MYIPIIKTTDAEINGYKNLYDDHKMAVLPLFELTKGRTHKVNYPEGRIEKTLEKALTAQDKGQLILDLTGHSDLVNSEINSLFTTSGGYSNWVRFIKNTGQNKRIIPAIQVDLDELDMDPDLGAINLRSQIRSLKSMCPRLALRISCEAAVFDILNIYLHISAELETLDDVLLIVDCEYIKPDTSKLMAKNVAELVNPLIEQYSLKNVAVSSSSFPRSVVLPGYGGERSGRFSLEEVKLHAELNKIRSDVKWIYSDYGLIHPKRYDTRGGTWIPRIDVPLRDEIFYARVRREAGGYEMAAKEVVSDSNFPKLDCWGLNQIKLAASSNPPGRNPSFWISVRSNIHLYMQALRTQTINS